MMIRHDTPSDVWAGALDISPLAAGGSDLRLGFRSARRASGFRHASGGRHGRLGICRRLTDCRGATVGRRCWGRRGDSGGSRSKPETVPRHRFRSATSTPVVPGGRLRSARTSRQTKIGRSCWHSAPKAGTSATGISWAELCALWWSGALPPWQALSLRTPSPNQRLSGWTSRSRPLSLRLHDPLWKGRTDLVHWLTAIFVVAASVRLAGVAPSWALILGGIAGAGMAGAIGHD